MSCLVGPKLRRADREMIATVVSVLNDCSYCTFHHAEALRHYWKDENRLLSLIDGLYEEAELTGVQLAMIAYATALTANPGRVSEDAIQTLRGHGLSDKAVLDLNLIVAYFNFVNRIAAGLGVSFDENEVGGYNY